MVNENDMGPFVLVSFCVYSFRWLQTFFFFFCIFFCLFAYWGFWFQLFVDVFIVLLLYGLLVWLHTFFYIAVVPIVLLCMTYSCRMGCLFKI